MKTIIRHGLLGAALLLCAALHAQNVQFHYDFGRAAYDRLGDRPLWTTTVEMLRFSLSIWTINRTAWHRPTGKSAAN